MRYFPSFMIGIILIPLTAFAFSISAKYSPALDYMVLLPDLNANSWEYFLLAIYEFLVKLFVATPILLLYKVAFSRLPFGFNAAVFMQLPFMLLVSSNLVHNSTFAMPGTVFDVFRLLGNISDCVTVLIAYLLIIASRKAFKRRT